MSKEDREITVVDFTDKEEPVCETWYKDSHWADVSEEVRTKCMISFCNKRDGNYWEFPYEEAMAILQEAKDHLSKLHVPQNSNQNTKPE